MKLAGGGGGGVVVGGGVGGGGGVVVGGGVGGGAVLTDWPTSCRRGRRSRCHTGAAIHREHAGTIIGRDCPELLTEADAREHHTAGAVRMVEPQCVAELMEHGAAEVVRPLRSLGTVLPIRGCIELDVELGHSRNARLEATYHRTGGAESPKG
jgi:hypothetical protein